MIYAPYNLTTHVPSDLQRTEIATRRFAQLWAATERRRATRRNRRGATA